MAITLSTGSSVAVAKTYTVSASFTAATNAAQCQLTTAAAHSLAVGDYIEVKSGWGLLDQRLVRCATGTTGSTIVLEGVNTTDTNKYPSGTGAGSFRKVSAWTTLSQVKSMSASGGEQQYADITSLQDVVIRQMPTVRGAVNMTIDCFDDPALAWYADVTVADESRTPFGLLLSFPNGSKLVANSYWSLLRVPTMAQNEALMTQISLSYAAEPVRYAT
jgi:hypothetical protein